RKLQKSFRTLEHSANLCLISLAVSDLMFCIFVFLTAFLPVNFLERDSFFYYYARYSYAVINVFIMESTMLTVAMSLERYMAICHPLRQDLYLTTRRIKYIIVYTYVFSVLFNLPVWWRFEPVTVCAANASIVIPEDGNLSCPCVAADFRPFNSTHSSGFSSAFSSSPPLSASIGVPQPSRYLYRHRRVPLYGSHVAEVSYRIAWAVVGNYVPLLLLVYFNFCLCRKIYRSYTRRKHLGRMDQPRSSSHILTVTLVAIVVLFFILVAPTETIIHVMEMSNSEESSSSEAILNLMQTINFSVNFILYCIISPYFRKTLKYMVLCGCYNIYQVSRNWKKEFETSLM
ncbi:FMRFamide receptor, partial [Biomphalaria pfeifferi]